MIIDKHFVFLHVPKTGGTWMRHILRNLPTFQKAFTEHLFEIPPEHRKKPVFYVVRNPWDWYLSLFSHFKNNYDQKVNEFDPRSRRTAQQDFLVERFGSDFETMLRHIERHGDYMSKTYARMPEHYHVLRFEDGLADGLLAFMRSVGAPANPTDIKRIQSMENIRFNSGAQRRTGPYYTEALRDLVAEKDEYVISKWNYQFEQPLVEKAE